MAGAIYVVDVDEHGIVATHPQRLELINLVAPETEAQLPEKFNTLRPMLVTIGCMRLYHSGFEFDSSFVAATSEDSFSNFARLMRRIAAQDKNGAFAPVSVFGHTDPTGDSNYNKVLSGRRARAVYAVLTRNADIWMELHDNPHGGDNWQVKSTQHILQKLTFNSDDELVFYGGPIDGKLHTGIKDAVGQWLFDRGLSASDKPSTLTPAQRRVLFLEYMDAICHDKDEPDSPFALDPETDFLARGADKQLKGDVQGCSEFNPLLLLSKEKEDLANKGKVEAEIRNDIYVRDRRVVVYIFKPGSRIEPDKWPCPNAKQDGTGCKKRFWSDAKDRIKPHPTEDRVFGEKMRILTVGPDREVLAEPVENTGNTMQCRFYHAFAQRSPCEAKLKEWVIRFKRDRVARREGDSPLIFMTGARYTVHVGETEDAAVMRGVLNKLGEVRIPVLDEQTRMLIKLDAWGFKSDIDEDAPQEDNPPSSSKDPNAKGFDSDRWPDEDKFMTYVLDGGALREEDVGDDFAVKQRLYNLGCGEGEPSQWTQVEFDAAMLAFRRRHGLEKADDASVRARIFAEHEHPSSQADAAAQSSPEPKDEA